MKQIIISTIFLIFISSTIFGQTVVKRNYKSFSDTTFKIGDFILAPKILFLLGRCDLDNRSNDSLKVIIDFIKKHPTFQIEIGMHIDNRVNPTSSIRASTCRAEKIRDYLINVAKLPADNITAKGYENKNLIVGDAEIKKAKTKEQKEELHQKNRRVELKILKT